MAEPAFSFDFLTQSDIAAATARENWLREARIRGGKQLPDDDDPNWSQQIFRAGRGFGKAIDLRTLIPTAQGWKHMGEVKEGDELFDEQGAICRVVKAWPVLLGRPCWRLTFDDGSSVICDEEHLWLTSTKSSRKASARAISPTVTPSVKSTLQIVNSLKVHDGREVNHAVLCARPLQGVDTGLTVPAYTFGYWLGDGDKGSPIITIHRDDLAEVVGRIASDGFTPTHTTFDKRNVNCARVSFGGHKTGRSASVGTLLYGLRQLGVLNAKSIPSQYLRASIQSRLSLLWGLMDSDGTAHPQNGTCEFTSMDSGLANGVLELVRSMGLKPTLTVGTATLKGRKIGPNYRVHFTSYFRVFGLERKAQRQKVERSQSGRQGRRYIVKAESISSVPVRCLTVDSPSRLYLVSHAMIPTHNTRAIIEWAWWQGMRFPNLIGHAVAPTLGDVGGTIMEGQAGFRACIPAECLAGESWDLAYTDKGSHHGPELTLKQGTVIRGFGARDQGGRLRGPQCHFAIGDELREWERPPGNLEYVHNNMMLGVRLPLPDGSPARACFGTTPKAIPYLKHLYKRSDVRVIGGSTYENLRNLSQSFTNTILSLEGTQAGKAEIYGEDSDSEEGGIFKRSWFRLWPTAKKLPKFEFIVQSMDTAFEDEHYDAKRQTSDFSACIVLGVFNTKQVFTDAELKRMGVRTKYAAVVCDLWNSRLSFPELCEEARKTYRTKWGSTGTGGSAGLAGGRRPDIVLIENKASGISLRQTLNTYGVPTWPFNPYSESKTMRAHAASPFVLQGHIFVPESMMPERKGLPSDWIEPMLEQVCSFAGEGSTEYDDLVDALVQAILYLSAKGLFLVEPMGRTMPDPDEEEERKEREAIRIAERQKQRLSVNPYD